MARKTALLTFNRGIVDDLASARADIKRVAMSAKTQMNWMPRRMGPMSLRPGLEYVGEARTAMYDAKLIPFVYSADDKAEIELTRTVMRVRINDVLITRAAHTAAITNPNFTSDIAGWTDADTGADALSAWITGGYMSLTGGGTSEAKRTQIIAIGVPQVERALRIDVVRGSCQIRLGTAAGLDDLISETTLHVGAHSLAFTATSGTNIHLQLFNWEPEQCLLERVFLEAAGTMEIDTNLLNTLSFDDVRYAASGDVIFLAMGKDMHPLRIERRGTNSWSIVKFVADDGPFRAPNATSITMKTSALTTTGGAPAVTLTASKAYFTAENVGSLISITSEGVSVTEVMTLVGDLTDPILVEGVTSGRKLHIQITGTWTGNVNLQKSVGDDQNWVGLFSYTTNQDFWYNDLLDNQVVSYRLLFAVATSGSPTATLTTITGSKTGVARILGYTSETIVTAAVLEDFGKANATTTTWSEGAWSARRGYPSGVAFFGGRLWWAGKDKIFGSAVDDFASYDPNSEGDSAPIDRSIGSGPVDTIGWLQEGSQLVMGAQMGEYLCRSTGFDEPFTPSNFNLRRATGHGSANVAAAQVDSSIIFVDRSGLNVIEAVPSAETIVTVDLSVLSPNICYPGIVRMAVQRRPDTRVHLVRSDGTVVILVFDKAEEVKCFVTLETEGIIEDVMVLPGVPEDEVRYLVTRTVGDAGGSTGTTVVRYIEKLALTSEAEGGAVNKIADSFIE